MGVTKKILRDGDGSNYPKKGDLLTMVSTRSSTLLYDLTGRKIPNRIDGIIVLRTELTLLILSPCISVALRWNSGI
jgi:hypothetical protein